MLRTLAERPSLHPIPEGLDPRLIKSDFLNQRLNKELEMPAVPSCTFVTLAGTADSPFLEIVLKHLLNMCSFPFHDVLLVVDDLPKDGGNAEEQARQVANLLIIAGRLQEGGSVSRLIKLSSADREHLSAKYFGNRRIKAARDLRGVPLFGWVVGLDAAETDFVMHFDSDILLHQDPQFDWIKVGMKLIEDDPSAMFVSPRPGPPTADGRLGGQAVDPTLDSQGNFRFKTFSSRRFLVKKRRFESFLPTPAVYEPSKYSALTRLGFHGRILPWEEFVNRSLSASSFYRVHLSSREAWSIHSPAHTAEWLQALPHIIKCVEQGQYPPEQAGYYDLVLPPWLSHVPDGRA